MGYQWRKDILCSNFFIQRITRFNENTVLFAEISNESNWDDLCQFLFRNAFNCKIYFANGKTIYIDMSRPFRGQTWNYKIYPSSVYFKHSAHLSSRTSFTSRSYVSKIYFTLILHFMLMSDQYYNLLNAMSADIWWYSRLIRYSVLSIYALILKN